MSLYQLIYLDKIPEYAIINEAVKIAKKEGYQTSQFVNAVLRNFTRNERRSLEELDELENKLKERLLILLTQEKENK